MGHTTRYYVILVISLVLIGAAAVGAVEQVSLALGAKVVTLPVVSSEAAFYSRMTDGSLDTIADWGDNWSDHTYVLIDLRKPEFIDEVRIYSGTTANYTGGWVNLKPHFAVYAGETIDKLVFLTERKPWENYDAVSLADAASPVVSFSGLNGFGRYVAVFVRNFWGLKINDIQVLKDDSRTHTPVRPRSTMSLDDLWMRDASLSAWLPMSAKVVTPHIAWSKPCASGSLRALFFMHKGQFRDIAELNQRMDLEWDWAPIIWNSIADQPEVPAMTIVEERKALNLLARDWDVIMLGASVKWSDLPASLRSGILEKVKSGVGLIYSNPLKECLLRDMSDVLSRLKSPPDIESHIARFALDKVRLMKPLPEDMLSVGDYGSGKVVLLTYSNFLRREKLNFAGSAFLPEFDFYKTMPAPSENFYAFLIDLMYSVSDRKPAVRISSAKAEEGTLVVKLNGSRALGTSLQCELRDKNYGQCGALSLNTSAGRPDWVRASADGQEQVLRIPLAKAFPGLRKGESFLNIWARDVQGAALDFVVVPVAGESPGIKAVETAKSGYTRAGGSFDVVLDSARAGDTVEAAAMDAYERLVWTASKRVNGGMVRFSMDLSDARSTAVTLCVTLKSKGVSVDEVKKTVACGLDDFDSKIEEFAFDIWGEAPFHFSRPWTLFALKQHRDAGVDCTTAYANYYGSQTLTDAEWDRILDDFFGTFAVNGIRPMFEYSAGVNSYLARNVDNRLWKPAEESRMVLGDPAFVSQYCEHVNRNLEVAKKWGTATYASGDEQQGWMSYDPRNIRAFGNWMKESYGGSIDRLNRNWGASYKSFDEVKPAELGNIGDTLSRAEMEEAKGSVDRVASKDELKAGRGDEIYTFAPWLEYRLFMDKLFADIHGTTLESLSRKDSRFRFGIEGTRYAGAIGFNWPYLMKNVNYITCYDEPAQAEIIRSYHSADTKTASWVGYDTHDKDELWSHMRPWVNLTRGLNGISFYESSNYRAFKDQPFHRYNLVAEDLDFSSSGAIYIKEMREIRKGIGRLILSSKQAPYYAAIRYSQASLVMGDYISTKSPRAMSVSYLIPPAASAELEMTERMLTDLGVHWRYVTDSEIEQGFLGGNRSIKLLVIPWGVCMSDAEAASLKRFMRAGGTVVSTGQFALLNERGFVHEKSLMRDIFGVGASAPDWMISKPWAGGLGKCGLVRGADLQVPIVYDDLKAIDGQVVSTFADSLPEIVAKKHGAGRAVFMNTYLSMYKPYLPDPLPGPYHDPASGKESMARAYRHVLRRAIGDTRGLRAVDVKATYYSEESAPYYRIGKFVGADGATYYPLIQESFRTSYYVPQESRMLKGQGLDCILKFDSAGHIYDVREKRYLGYGGEVKANIYTCEAKVYAVLPYRVKNVTLTLPRAAKRGKDFAAAVTVAVDSKQKLMPRTNINLEFYGPDGKEVRHYSRNLLVDGANGRTVVRLALNDKPGVWRVKATDTVSGSSSYAFLKVQ